MKYQPKFKKTGWAIAILNILMIMQSTFYFLAVAKFPVEGWLFFNACAPSIMIYLAGFFLKRVSVMAAALPFLSFFGVGGLFVFGWDGTSIYAQMGHICMSLAILYIAAEIYFSRLYKNFGLGLAAGLAAFTVIFPIQQSYVASHPGLQKKLGDPKFEKYMDEKNQKEARNAG